MTRTIINSIKEKPRAAALYQGEGLKDSRGLNALTRAPDGAPPSPGGRGLELVFRADPTIFDGRFSNNAWLQELPKPLTKIVWDNVALLSPDTANRLNLSNEDVI